MRWRSASGTTRRGRWLMSDEAWLPVVLMVLGLAMAGGGIVATCVEAETRNAAEARSEMARRNEACRQHCGPGVAWSASSVSCRCGP